MKPNEYPLVFLCKRKQCPLALGPTGNSAFAPGLRHFSQLEPVDSAPIAEAEAREFYHALHLRGMFVRAVSSSELCINMHVMARNTRCVQATCK